MYNIKQMDAINSDESKLVIIAPPGSGKTHTMTGAIKYYIDKKNPIKVIAVTFTNKAANELRDRLFDYGNTLHTATIHSWSYSELKNLSVKHGFRIKLLEEEQILAIIRPMLNDYAINSRSVYSVYNHCLGNINPDLAPYVKAKYDAIRDRYTDFKRKKYLYDFTDLPLYLKTKLEDYNEYITVDALFVDEFQDVDPTQLTVFDRVIADKKFFIGDPDQSIYIFRGATEEIFNQLNGFAVYKLITNYRSYQVILDFATCFKKQRPTSLRLTYHDEYSHIQADRGSDKGVVYQELFSNNMIKYTASFINEERVKTIDTIRKELNTFQYQVLCRTNKEVKELEKIGFYNISTIHKAKGLEFENVIVVDFEIESDEDVNVGYVALTRAKNRMMIVGFQSLLNAGQTVDRSKLLSPDLRTAF
jgi:superfamily I DNA/RNA helicase